MTTQSSTQSTSRTSTNGETGDTVQAAMREVRGAIENVSRQVPDVARASRGAVDDLFKVIETGSDERVTAGVSLSLGLALGMLLGSAPRLLVIIALAPVVAAGLVMADRRSKGSTSRSSSAS